jgi:predicted nucleic acid-binding protein
LIALDKIGLLDDLENLFDELVIPPAVAVEIAPTVRAPSWIAQRSLTQPVDPQLLSAALGPGETEAIALAMERGSRLVLIDELAGRKTANHLKVPVVGTLGLLLVAKEEGIVGALAPVVQALLATGFFASPTLINAILVRAGEPPSQPS